ncbi:MAG: hypothetical protein Q9218_005761 [Villophora microphyllina]
MLSPEVQQFGQTFCPSILAAASQKATPSSVSATPSTSSHVSPQTVSNPASSLTAFTTPATTPVASSADSTPSSRPTGANDLGVGIEGTRWKSVQNTSNVNRGPAIEALLVGGIVISIIVGVRYGMGKHQDHQTGPEVVKIIHVVYSFTLIIVLCFWSLKLSILCLYLRMTPEKKHRKAIYCITNIFECTPISSFWNLQDIFSNHMHCINIIAMDIFTNSWSAFEDLVIWALPLPILWSLKVPSAKKFGLYTLIAISFISVICATIRVAAFVIWINSSDISWNFPIYPLLCTIESCVALITSSLYAIYPLFRKPAPEHRRSVVPVAPSDSEKQWDSQGSTLQSAQALDKRSSRWSFLNWKPPGKKGVDEGGVVKSVPEEEPEEGRPPTQHTMTAYVSSTDEARSVDEKVMALSSHRRRLSSEEESLCYVGKGSAEVSPISAVGEVR